MLNDQGVPHVGTASPTIHVGRDAPGIVPSLLLFETPADDAAIGGRTTHLNAQHLAVFEEKLQNFAVLRHRW